MRTSKEDQSGPSTSRQLSPIPPVKRAKTANGTPSASRRTSTGSGRQARIHEFIDEKDLQEALLNACMETADEIMKKDVEEGKEKLEIDNEVISATARIVWDALSEDWAADLIAFSRHAGREVIREDDVKLLMRRNPDLLASIQAEIERDDERSAVGATKRRSTGVSRPAKERKEYEVYLLDELTNATNATSVSSVVPETPHGRGPLAHSTPVSLTGIRKKEATSFALPSPIREEIDEGKSTSDSGRRVSRSIMEDLSRAVDDDQCYPMVIDLRHPREREEEERNKRAERESEDNFIARSQTAQQELDLMKEEEEYGREGSPELFERTEMPAGRIERDSFDDVDVLDEKPEKSVHEDISTRMSESAVLKEMLDGDEEGKKEERKVEKKGDRDSFDDDPFPFLVIGEDEENAAGKPSPIGCAADHAKKMQQVKVQPAAAIEDSFECDYIIGNGSNKETAAAATSLPRSQQERIDDYDSFEDDDDFIVKEMTPRAKAAASSINKSTRGVFADDVFGLSDVAGPSKETRRPLPSTTGKQQQTASSVKQPAVRSIARRDDEDCCSKGPSEGFSSFSFFGSDTPTPQPARGDSDFVRTPTSAARRGARGGRFPRKVDPNSRVSRMIREQSTPVRLSPRPPSKMSEVVDSFEDEDFDASAFDD